MYYNIIMSNVKLHDYSAIIIMADELIPHNDFSFQVLSQSNMSVWIRYIFQNFFFLIIGEKSQTGQNLLCHEILSLHEQCTWQLPKKFFPTIGSYAVPYVEMTFVY